MSDADRPRRPGVTGGGTDDTQTGGVSRSVTSSQTGPHDDLERQLRRHAQRLFAKPITDYNRNAFDQVTARMAAVDRPLILDSGCGTGDSSRLLARRYPDHWVIGVDRSADRLSRQRPDTPPNCLLVRADLVDFWRLARQAGWTPARHYLLYPNPEPKPRHLKRRFHAHPVFPSVVALGGRLESRSNWRVYLEELALALEFHGRTARVEPVKDNEPPMTPFERKYRASGQPLWRLISDG
ncbi:methyltransferase domain-containing protein [Guyparkeria halophila]|uniref:tRNA (guanine(46)-N(7))-methyltransferase n=1 Tax=Guyparkeria halophila TaxID=47960 RepID=A0A6I6CYS2_9GAMM|nr:methyltransferase domain-containing protein [Guyparkeria halophila]QGT78560.1 methyltransferase domain-containing protein [Guyparkeria halophila]